MLNKIIWGNITFLHLLMAVVILLVAGLIAKILSLYIRRILKEKVSKDHLQLIIKIVSFTVYAIAILSAFAVLGLKLTGVLFGGAMAGIILGFASQSIVGNFIAGIFLIIEKPIKIGDQVNIEDMTGFVEDIRIISTSIRTYDGLYVRIPNQTVFTTKMTNYVGNIVRRFDYMVGIRYSDDADKAIAIIKDVIEQHPFALKKPKPLAYVDNLGDNAVNIMVRIWAPVSEWYELKQVMLWKIKATLEQEGIEIAFPQRTLWFANELESKNVDSG
ncbi:MAG TPA: mechanosensitive ion channel family protein [Candidatus Heimdallarchaeota archaeon]|nr:mechanosensitive ion channel family protein [Candidatus Heimdallarchaeota archaeon]